MFRALVLHKDEAGFRAGPEALDDARLAPLADGDVALAVEYSTLNYKDGLALTNRGPVVRRWPMVPGIDGAGTVIESRHPRLEGRATGWCTTAGASARHAGVAWLNARGWRATGLVRLPAAFTARQAMAIGTAGYTAMLCVMALEQHGLAPGDGRRAGHRRHRRRGQRGSGAAVAAGSPGHCGHRQGLARRTTCVHSAPPMSSTAPTSSAPGKPLQKERWAAVVDAVGSHTLANALAQTRYGGVVAACGLAQGADLPATVMPFILRGVTLAGVDSVMAPLPRRQTAWQRLARDLDPALLERITDEIALDDAVARAHDLMAGRVRGRLVVRIA